MHHIQPTSSSSATPMCLKSVDSASHRFVASELVNLITIIDDFSLVSQTIEIINSVVLKKWRIAHTFAVYKSDDL
jgi:hypothetical protein